MRRKRKKRKRKKMMDEEFLASTYKKHAEMIIKTLRKFSKVMEITEEDSYLYDTHIFVNLLLSRILSISKSEEESNARIDGVVKDFYNQIKVYYEIRNRGG